MLLTTVGAFAAFSLMAIAIGTDYWLYSSAHICNGTNITTDEAQGPPRRARGDLTHSGLWRICCLEGTGGQRCAGPGGRSNFPGEAAARPEPRGSAQPEPEPEPLPRTRPRRRMALPWQPASPRLPWEPGGGMRSSARGSSARGGRPRSAVPLPRG